MIDSCVTDTTHLKMGEKTVLSSSLLLFPSSVSAQVTGDKLL